MADPDGEDRDRVLTGRGIVLLVVIAVVVGGLSWLVGLAAGAGHGRAAETHRLMNQTSTGSVTVPDSFPALVGGDGKQLKRYLAPIPAGGIRAAADGVQDADAFIEANRVDSELGGFALEELQFQIAVTRDWIGADGLGANIELVEFASPDNARTFAEAQDRTYRTADTVTGRTTIRGTDDCHLYRLPAFDSVGNRRAVANCVDRNIDIVIAFFVPDAYDDAAELAVLQGQLDALGRGDVHE
jgi:hypothetical protein